MKTNSTIFFMLLAMQIGIGQQLSNNNEQIKPPSEFFPKNRAKVLVMGTFHFNFPGLDAHKTSDSNKIDVLKEPKKTEVTQLVEYIKKFKPNKIFIEAKTDWNDRYEAYKKGEYRDKRDERYQVAMRIANELHIDSIQSIDAPTLESELREKDSVLTISLLDKVDWEAEDPYWDMAFSYIEHRDSMMKKVHLLDFLKNMNTRESHNTNFGLYLTGQFANADYDGADKLTIWWYSRNARIFANIARLSKKEDDRILVVIGNGHAAILRQFLEASPQFDFIEFDSLSD
ncbi:DUF5694 domain-containing protein [Flagellimonas sp. 389]|uniref:DUF5694 domain-containing protein n=1 Tax=Flagellimonas sp. 389 TaxID=2835862 RepID=UPI00202305BB|nr:DUF5694 domain-containing protein [Flagellimonas sp. 389]